MKKSFVFGAGLVIAVILTNGISFIRDCRNLENLRKSVLRLHILADSDGERDQQLKLKVRDAIIESDVLNGAESLAEAEEKAAENLTIIEEIAEETLRENGCYLPVVAEIADVAFDERVYGEITMPAGVYRSLRVKIGSAEGRNWWCVMYPPLCLPAASDVTENKEAEECFSRAELDIMYNPQKYEIRFAVWDKIKEIIDR